MSEIPGIGRPDKNKWRFALTTLTLITVIVIFIFIKVYIFVPVPALDGIPLVVVDEHWVAWMPLDNGFTQAGISGSYWNGVLIQVGRYWERDPDGLGFFPGFVEVVIDGTGGSQTLKKGEFDWINIVSERPNETAPITPAESGLLWPDPGKATVCMAIDECAEPYTGTGTSCVCMNPPCEEDELELIPPECVRLRSVHSHFMPEALITYWQGPNGYGLLADQVAHGGKHNEYTFYMKDPVKIEAYKDGSPLPMDVGEVTKIMVFGKGDIDHGEVTDPGLDGGEFGS